MFLGLMFLGLIIVSSAVTYILYNDKVGSCSQDDRRLSDDEIIDRAISQIIKAKKTIIYEDQQTKEYDIAQYSNIQEFKSQNVGCCKLERSYIRFWPLNHFKIGTATNISISYTEQYADDAQILKSHQRQIEDEVTACGVLMTFPR